ncbi:hypothetical protein [Paenibacillus sp. FSL W8-0194]|uniref:hypothetical protein n=1 Tax=Paenibacillus sp. FSL W8-0194 TaxID=2921711 RepID=UPI0030DC40E9
MNTSSFISGVLIGAAATALVSRSRGNITSAIASNAGKMMDIGSIGSIGMNNHESRYSEPHSKVESMKQINEFINSNPDVKREVDSILKETNTVIPGL